MFQFPGFAATTYGFSRRSPCGGVAPFGNSRIKACSQLPGTYRNVLRPSSPLSAKASTRCPYCACSLSVMPGDRPSFASRPAEPVHSGHSRKDTTRIGHRPIRQCLLLSHFTMSKSPEPEFRPARDTPSPSSCADPSTIPDGGGERDRTDDLLLAKQALSQLSYTPVSGLRRGLARPRGGADVVGLGRLELPTSRLSGVRSNHLSYRPDRCPGSSTRCAGRGTGPQGPDLAGSAGREAWTAATVPANRTGG